jgi:hypothetical protein
MRYGKADQRILHLREPLLSVEHVALFNLRRQRDQQATDQQGNDQNDHREL